MSQLLRTGQTVRTVTSGLECTVGNFLGGGGQGEVYKAELDGSPIALKWYFPHYLQQDRRLRERLEEAIKSGRPSDRFLWPMELASANGVPSFGYVMPLREPRFIGIVDMMVGRADPSFRALATAGFDLAHNYHLLHSKGLCYRDISFGNVFFDSDTGDVRICDNDNVDFDGKQGAIGGTPDFMAPEIVCTPPSSPNKQTDLFSLSVLLFYMLHIHHPLQGKKMMSIHSWDLPARRKILGEEPVFIFDPVNKSNEAVGRDVDSTGEAGDNALSYWNIYPQFLRNRFTEAFTTGLKNPQARITESIWRREMIRLRDSIIYCVHCGRQNFYCSDKVRSNPSNPGVCWSPRCGKPLQLPPRIRIVKNTSPKLVMLNHDTQLFPFHIDDTSNGMYDFGNAIAVVNRHPTDPTIWGLKNLSTDTWTTSTSDGTIKQVEPGRSVTLSIGTKIAFGTADGTITI